MTSKNDELNRDLARCPRILFQNRVSKAVSKAVGFETKYILHLNGIKFTDALNVSLGMDGPHKSKAFTLNLSLAFALNHGS